MAKVEKDREYWEATRFGSVVSFSLRCNDKAAVMQYPIGQVTLPEDDGYALKDDAQPKYVHGYETDVEVDLSQRQPKLSEDIKNRLRNLAKCEPAAA